MIRRKKNRKKKCTGRELTALSSVCLDFTSLLVLALGCAQIAAVSRNLVP